jgi:hypothetical protein
VICHLFLEQKCSSARSLEHISLFTALILKTVPYKPPFYRDDLLTRYLSIQDGSLSATIRLKTAPHPQPSTEGGASRATVLLRTAPHVFPFHPGKLLIRQPSVEDSFSSAIFIL